MRTKTRLMYNTWLARIAELNGINVGDANKNFTVDPTVAQALYEKVQSSSEFLKSINLITVPAQQGAKVGIVITRPIASRTDTSTGNKRNPGNPTDTVGRQYKCEQTNFDTALRYALLDAWANRPEFQTLIRDAIAKRQGIDRMIIGWNGTSVAATTDPVANPLLQDVNKGWIQNLREQAPAQIIGHGDIDPTVLDGNGVVTHQGHIYVDAAGQAAGKADYSNLDALVFDLIENLEEPFRDDTGLVAICGRDLVHDKYFNLVNDAGDNAMQQVARDVLLSTKKIGGLPAVRVPYFPPGKLAITRLDNLSIYDQEGSERRMVWEQPDLDRICDFQSVNEAYVIEENGLITVAENIVMGAKPAPAGN